MNGVFSVLLLPMKVSMTRRRWALYFTGEQLELLVFCGIWMRDFAGRSWSVCGFGEEVGSVIAENSSRHENQKVRLKQQFLIVLGRTKDFPEFPRSLTHSDAIRRNSTQFSINSIHFIHFWSSYRYRFQLKRQDQTFPCISLFLSCNYFKLH